MLGKYDDVRHNPVSFVDRPQVPKRHIYRRFSIHLDEMVHLPMEMRLFVLGYVKTGRADVAYECAYPEAKASMSVKARRGRAILAKPEIDTEIVKALGDIGVKPGECFKVLKELMDLTLDHDNPKKAGDLKLKSALALLGMLEKQIDRDNDNKQDIDEALGLSLVEGLEESNELKAKRNKTA